MTSKELVSVNETGGRLMSLGAQSIDLNLIYNAHGTPKDAILSVRQVMPDSVVFLEGYTTQVNGSANYERELTMLNGWRLQSGKEHEDYKYLKKAILDATEESMTNYEPTGPNDFTLCNLAAIQALLSKDCLVYYADYRPISAEHINADEAEAHNQFFQDNAQHLSRMDLPDIESTEGIGRAIKQLRDSVRGDAIAHALREGRAAATILLEIGDMVSMRDITELHKDEYGKISTYLLYGSAHERSLAWQFESKGIKPKVVQLHPVAEGQYIDAIQAPGYDNHGRRLGYIALRSLTYGFLELESARAITDKSYEHLEFLNSVSREERLSFLITCALIRREERRNPDEAFRQYYSILRSFMPSPQDFVA